MGDENNKYKELFFQESDEYLEVLNTEVLKLEEDPNDEEILDNIFRVAHTLKGMAASMGYATMTTLSHSMENVFELFRSSKVKVSTDNISLIFTCIDSLTEIVEDLRLDNDGEIDISEVLKELDELKIEGSKEKRIKKDKEIENMTSEERVKLENAKKRGLNIYKINIMMDEDCQLMGARAFLVLSKLSHIGEVFKSSINEDLLEEGICKRIFGLIFISKLDEKEIYDEIDRIPEVDSILIKKFILEKPKAKKVSEKKTRVVSNLNNEFIKVPVDQIDEMMDMVSELVIHRIAVEDIVDDKEYSEVLDHLTSVSSVTSTLQRLVLDIRMQPISVVFNRFPRMMRDLSIELGKDIDFIIEGEDTELDKTIISELSKPLVHLLRNAADHGIELKEERMAKGKNPTGTIKLRAKHSGDRVIIFVEDDGRGIDFKKLRQKAEDKGMDTQNMTEKEIQDLVFSQGITSNDSVTSISGRGVGMDVVNSKVKELGGRITISSEIDVGSTIVIELPLSLLVIKGFLFRLGDIVYAIPLEVVERVFISDINNIEIIDGEEYYSYEDELVNIFDLHREMGVSCISENRSLIIISILEKKYGFFVDELLGDKDIVIKKLGIGFKNNKEYIGATVLANGDVALILDIVNIIKSDLDEKTRGN